MSIKVSQTIQDLLNSIDEGAHAALNFHCSDDTLLEELAADLESRLGAYIITFDIQSYASYDDLIRELIMRLLLRDDRPTNVRVPETAIDEMSQKLLSRHINRLLSAFKAQGTWVCLILKHFDDAPRYWDDYACAAMRELIDSGKIPACIILSSNPIGTITELPIGSSPLNNIFKIYRLDGDAR